MVEDGSTEKEGEQTRQPAPRRRAATWFARTVVALVFAVNVQWPGAYAGGFELSGVAGDAAVRGMGVAFLMWNATYPLVIVRPQRHRALFGIVLAQQAIGLAGEGFIRATLPAGHAALAASIDRFIAFDAFGLILMLAAFIWLAWPRK